MNSYQRNALREMGEEIRREVDPVWKQVLVEGRQFASKAENWERENGTWVLYFDSWQSLVGVTGGEAQAVAYLEAVADG